MNHLNGRARSNKTATNYGHLLQNVPAHILQKVLDIYHLDFVMFGYDKEELDQILEEKQNLNTV